MLNGSRFTTIDEPDSSTEIHASEFSRLTGGSTIFIRQSMLRGIIVRRVDSDPEHREVLLDFVTRAFRNPDLEEDLPPFVNDLYGSDLEEDVPLLEDVDLVVETCFICQNKKHVYAKIDFRTDIYDIYESTNAPQWICDSCVDIVDIAVDRLSEAVIRDEELEPDSCIKILVYYLE